MFLTLKYNINIIHTGVALAAENAKFPSLAENAAQMRRWTKFINIYITDDRTSGNQALGLGYVTSYIKSFMLVK